MDPLDAELRDRLERLEAAVPIRRQRVAQRSPLTRLVPAGIVVALIGVTLVAGSVVAGVVPVGQPAQAHPGLFNPGQPLNCSGVERMTPPDAARYLADRGYVVTWQIEDVDAHTSHQSATPPETGNVIEGVLEGRAMTLVVEVGANARQATPPACSP